jgi:DNA polymerase I-like protein with 3'-5' exonuclease and polymerase domains
MTAVEACQFQKRFFAAYPQLRKWQEGIRKRAWRGEPVHTKGGRVRTFKSNETSIFPKSLNTPVQGTAGEIQLRALTLVEEELSRFEDARIVNAVHDEIVVIAREEDADAVARLLQECMTRAFLEMFPDAPTMGLVECSVGKNWADAQ